MSEEIDSERRERMVQNHKRQEALKQKKEIEKDKLSQITSTEELLQYRIGGIYCGDKFLRIDLQKIFERKKFCDFTIVIMIEGCGRSAYEKIGGCGPNLCALAFLLASLFSISVVFTFDCYSWPPCVQRYMDSTCKEEPGNIDDLYAVAVRRQGDDITVGHVPRTISTVVAFF